MPDINYLQAYRLVQQFLVNHNTKIQKLTHHKTNDTNWIELDQLEGQDEFVSIGPMIELVDPATGHRFSEMSEEGVPLRKDLKKGIQLFSNGKPIGTLNKFLVHEIIFHLDSIDHRGQDTKIMLDPMDMFIDGFEDETNGADLLKEELTKFLSKKQASYEDELKRLSEKGVKLSSQERTRRNYMEAWIDKLQEEAPKNALEIDPDKYRNEPPSPKVGPKEPQDSQETPEERTEALNDYI